MKYNKKYIKNILTHTDNFSEIFLREMGAHSSIKSFSKEIKDKLPIDNLADCYFIDNGNTVELHIFDNITFS